MRGKDDTAAHLARKGRQRNIGATRSPFGFELYLISLARKGQRSVPDVVWSICGTDSSGRATASHFFTALEAVDGRDNKLLLLEHWCRTFEHARMHGSQYRASGPRTYVGKQHEWYDGVDEQTGEVKPMRRHVPARRGGRAGALAAHSRRSPRQLNRYRRTLRRAKLMTSKQPDSRAKDATLPRARRPNGRWAYAQHWLPFVPSSLMVRRWALAARQRNERQRNQSTCAVSPASAERPDFASDVDAALRELGVEP